MGKVLFYTFLFLSWGGLALAQTLVPATSEDLSAFDEQISQSRKNPDASQFGTKVSEEAKNLKNLEAAQKKKAVKGVVDPRDKEESAQLGAGRSNSSGKDAKVSSPKNSDKGNSGNAPGHNKKK